MDIVIERATPADAEVLVAVQIAAFHDDVRLHPGVELGGPPGYDSVETALQKIRDDDVYRILWDGQIVGVLIVVLEAPGRCHLDVICVDPAYHNRGIGTRAMEFLHETYAAEKWTLDTPKYATRNQHFYEKFGYVKTSEFEVDGFALYSYER